MVYKPLSEASYRKLLKIVGWDLVKSKIDYKLLDDKGTYLCTIQISHSKKSKQEVTAYSIKKTEREFKFKGLTWPPKRNKTTSKNSFRRDWQDRSLVRKRCQCLDI